MKYSILIIITAFSLLFIACAPSRKAVHFDGDDYIEIGDHYDDINFPVTITAWLNLDSVNAASPIFVSQDNTPLYKGFSFITTPFRMGIEYGDGKGQNHHAYRKAKAADIKNITNKWVFVTAVMRSETDFDMYINGKNVGGEYVGSTSLPMSSNYPTDVAKIGYRFSNGLHQFLHGKIDEVALWNRSFKDNEILELMCKKLKGKEKGLIGLWNFDEKKGEVIKDKSVNKYHGRIKGNMKREMVNLIDCK